jgi:hypothetical protein
MKPAAMSSSVSDLEPVHVPHTPDGPVSAVAARLLASLIIALVSALLGGCADGPMFDRTPARTAGHPKATAVLERSSSSPAAARTSARTRDADDAARESAALQEGIRLYNDGDYNGAIRRLGARDVNNGLLATRLTALKYTAFSYCLTSRPAQCRQAFDKALRLDPSFDLAPGEHGHPLWGPVFTKAKQAVAAR